MQSLRRRIGRSIRVLSELWPDGLTALRPSCELAQFTYFCASHVYFKIYSLPAIFSSLINGELRQVFSNVVRQIYLNSQRLLTDKSRY